MKSEVINNIYSSPVNRVAVKLEERFTFTFSLAVALTLGGTFIAANITVFLVSVLHFVSPVSYYRFLGVFWIFLGIFFLLGTYIHFGLFQKFGLGPFSPHLRRCNRYFYKGEFLKPDDPYKAVLLLESLEKVPLENMKAALIYPSIVMASVVIQEVVIGSTFNAVVIFIGILSAILIYVFLTYVLSEVLSCDKRILVKEFLVEHGISFEEKYYISIRHKLVAVTFIVFIAMTELGGMLYRHSLTGTVLLSVLFIVLTALLVGMFLYLYQISIARSLKQIEKAAMDMARGGVGKVYIGGLDRELINAGRGMMKAAYEIVSLQENLEKRVDERTEELNDSMRQMEDLQNLQAGDYFLTSLLIDPLVKNNATGVNVTVDFYLKQKKTFMFRKWEKEIGGDLCIAHTFFLKGKLYTVFMNADAMGKSMQGAGGVLVLGSGFQAIIDRTRFSSMEQDQYPEFWLRKAHMELHRLFEGFNGSMLMSLVMGLVDDETGMVYFINAEHPWTVLYRENSASFLEKELLLWKLGVEQDLTMVKIRTFRMEGGDILIAGSDGRDDILISGDSYDEETMNEDEELFLKHVEKGNGDLSAIAKGIEEAGKITDDLSLLRIKYGSKVPHDPVYEKEVSKILKESVLLNRRDEKEKALEFLSSSLDQYKGNARITRQLIKYYVQQKRYSDALPYGESYVEDNPEDTEFVHIYSFCLKKVGRIEEAAAHSRRCHLRNPDESRYALHLAQLLIDMKDYLEADKILDVILSFDPDNKDAYDLKQSM